MKKLKGNVTISAYHGSKTGVMIRIEDELSGCTLVECDLSMTEYALAITGLGMRPCKMSVNMSGVIGKTREHKVVSIKHDIQHGNVKALRELMSQWEVDGWTGRLEDMRNFHNHMEDGYQVLFERWV
jgi:hypothetical protein